MKCYKTKCLSKAIIRFEYKDFTESYCLQHLVERLNYIKDNKLLKLITEIKEIIPIYNF